MLLTCRYWLTLVVCLVAGAPAIAQPAQVILIRHGEKTDDDKDVHLSTFGRCRAAALVPYFLETDALLKFGKPVAIYAQNAPNPKKNSLRPIETIQPLADSLKLEVQHQTERDKFQQMVDEVMSNSKYQGKMVVVCWEHERLTEIAPAFLKYAKNVKGAPKEWKWEGKHFDRTWVITFTDKDNATFEQHLQRLMFGDSKD
ncbi:MAG: histidine phosphatase family protein [Planctomycetaceae bacterium]|nr:histidine phosphatase family protein [Planctomycetaceae bacterium]